MKNQLASLEVNYLIKELKILLNSRVDKIFQTGKKEFYFQFYVSNVGKKILRITDKLVYLTEKKPAITEPPGFCMFLRKQLDNSRLKEIKQKESERIIEFLFEGKNTRKLIVELFGGGNLLILDENDVILSAAHYERYRDREVLAKSPYKYPRMEHNLFELKLKEVKELFKKTKKENLVKCLATELGLGGVYSEEVCLLSKLNKNEKPLKLKEKEINEINSIIKKLVNKKINAVIVYDKEAVDVTPFSLEFYKELEAKKFKSFNSALEYYFTHEFKEVKKEKSAYEKKLEKLERIIAEQKLMIKEMEKGEKENRAKAEMIYNNYQLVKEVLDEIKKAKEKYSWEEIKEKLKGHKLVKDVDVKEKKVVVEIK